MWLPAERLDVADRAPVVGYVLQADDEAVVVLHDRDRRVERIPTSRVEARAYCTVSKDDTPLLQSAYALVRAPDYPNCRLASDWD